MARDIASQKKPNRYGTSQFDNSIFAPPLTKVFREFLIMIIIHLKSSLNVCSAQVISPIIRCRNDDIKNHTDSLRGSLLISSIDSYHQETLSFPGTGLHWAILR